MTNWSQTSNGQPSGSTAAERPTLRPAPGTRRSSGTLVSVDLAARLFGVRLLTLRAEVRVAPAPVDVVGRAAVRGGAPAPDGRQVGAGLADAAQAIRSGARDLQAARDLSGPR